MKLVFATNNQHKLHEIKQLIGSSIQLLSLADIDCNDDIPENQKTIEGNASEKAFYIWNKYQINCFADDTGLEVDALGGAPGVYSARYAGPQRDPKANMARLLMELEGKERAARFRTVIALIDEQGALTVEGVVRGSIAGAPRGRGGFGYDPVFVPEGWDRSFAEMDLAAKNAISHRRRAVDALVAKLATRYR